MRYEGNIFRPFSEADSYLLQVSIGCSHNRCTFCGMYKDRKYRVRSLVEIREDIRLAKDHCGDVEKVFLCDGDAIDLPTDLLLEILKELSQAFPALRHVGTYVGPQSTLRKSMSELTALRAAGLTKAYLGVESGDENVLKAVNKGVGYAEMLKAGQNLVLSGMNLSAMVMLGIAGRGAPSRAHAAATARIIDAMKPRYLAALTYTPVPHTALYAKVAAGEFTLPDAFETLEEMQQIFASITMDNLKFVGAHASNYLPISGTLQKDKARMLAAVEAVLASRDRKALRSEALRGL